MVACSSNAAVTTPQSTVVVETLTTTPTYATEVQPLFIQHCVSCHSGIAPGGGYRMESYEQVMTSGANTPNVVAGDLNSNLLRMLRGETISAGGQMPPDALLSPQEIAIIVRWVETGAQP
jgi:mono/diheme cytochrome c family protein